MAESDIARVGRRVINFFFDSPPVNNSSSGTPIYCLGVRYENPPPPTTETNAEPVIISHSVPSPSESLAQSSELTSEPEEITRSQIERNSQSSTQETAYDSEKGGWPAPFLDDFDSRVWMTYRSGFAPIPRDPNASANMSFMVKMRTITSQEGFTSDTGWGCMIRSGQSLLANAMILSELGRDWRHSPLDNRENKIISLFADDPEAPFSIHKFVQHGAAACGKHPGEWFGPSAAAKCIQALTNRHKLTNLAVYITVDGSEVYEDEVFEIATAKTGSFQPTLILIGTRLGHEKVTPVYREALKAALQIPQAIGIAGGRPSSSHYFIGTQGSDFFYLDPHHTRPTLPLHTNASEYTTEEIRSCHTRRLRRLSIDGMDPSMLVGFLIKDPEDWKRWRRGVSEVPGKAIVHVHDRKGVSASAAPGRKGAIEEVETFDTEDDDEL